MPKVSKQSASHVDDHDRVSGHLLTVLFKNGTRLAGSGSEAFFRVDASSVRRSGSHQRPINNEAASPLPPTVSCLAEPSGLIQV